MKKTMTMTIIGASALVLASCGPQPSTGGSNGGVKICPADQMQGLVGKPATEAGRFLAKVPAEQRTPTYYVGERQELPSSIERGATLVVLKTPVVISSPDLSAYDVAAVKCFTGAEWAN